ncbi:hypothetical protein ABIB99_008469 [Bradyrhizobium sp. LA6.1]|uniref:hypothetical protein n=1 Tax=Bradyrhizobium sp. LA6.1 TaxID=3156378 RepID=UPI0033998D95
MADDYEKTRTVYFTDENTAPELFKAIGHFMFQFSQLEAVIRNSLASALGLKTNKNGDLITSAYDFRALCDVTSGFLCNLYESDGEYTKEVKSVFNACKTLNEDRVRVAHGTWLLDGGTRHVSRQTFSAQDYFLKPGELQAKTKQAFDLMSKVIQISLGRVNQIKDPPEA